MIAVTSLAPSHKNKDNQQRAIDSWKAKGFTVYSINSKEEIEKLDYDINYIETNETCESLYGKPYVSINAFMTFIKEYGDALIINSDIIIDGDIEGAIQKSRKGLLILNRFDYVEDISKAKIFTSGFDAFFVTKQLANIFPNTQLAMGQCHWDYLLPYWCTLKRIDIFSTRIPIIKHKVHELQYNKESWERTARIFSNETSLKGSLSNISRAAYSRIYSRINLFS
jgi:hypothetical protein